MTSSSPFSDQAALQSQAEAEQQQTPEQEEQMSEADLRKAVVADLKKIFGDEAPTEADLDAWKQQCGRLRTIWFGDEEIYFYRPFRVAEYRGWLESLKELAQKDPAEADRQLQEKVVINCVVFPKISHEDIGSLFGGTLDTLYAQIRMASNFYPMEQAVMLVQEW